MCDGNDQIDPRIADFVRLTAKLQRLYDERSLDISDPASLIQFGGDWDRLNVMWQRILGAAEAIGLSEDGLRSRRADIISACGANLGEWVSMRFKCSYALE